MAELYPGARSRLTVCPQSARAPGLAARSLLFQNRVMKNPGRSNPGGIFVGRGRVKPDWHKAWRVGGLPCFWVADEPHKAKSPGAFGYQGLRITFLGA